jgi:hypothetical protein
MDVLLSESSLLIDESEQVQSADDRADWSSAFRFRSGHVMNRTRREFRLANYCSLNPGGRGGQS